MKVTPTSIPDVLIIEPVVYRDERGFFMEQFQQDKYRTAIGRDIYFVQDNFSQSTQHVVRGLHFQLHTPQAKLIQVTNGSILDVVVDIRPISPTFGQWVSTNLNDKNGLQLWVPEGFAHGFLTLSERADVFYKTTAFYKPEDERTLKWDDADIGIEWPITAPPILSVKDKNGASFKDLKNYL